MSGWIANPSSDPEGAERAIWAVRTAAPGVTWRVVEGATAEPAKPAETKAKPVKEKAPKPAAKAKTAKKAKAEDVAEADA